MAKIGIRCDCGNRMGMGHIARQKLIYGELKKNHEVHFFMEEGADLVNLPLMDVSRIKEMDCLIIDLLWGFERYDFPGKKIAFYDGPEMFDCDADVVFALNYNQIHLREKYTGWSYIPMLPGLSEIKREYKGRVKKILVMTSGIDHWNMPEKIYEAIKNLGYEVSILISKAYPRDRLKSDDVEILSDVDDMVDLYSKYDLLICTAGNVLFEAAASGLPSISFSVCEVQDGHAELLEKAGFSIHLGGFWDGSFIIGSLPDAIDRFNDPVFREKCSVNGRKVCDGKGLKKVVDTIERIANGQNNSDNNTGS